MVSKLLQPLIALVLSRDRISNHFDHRFEDEAGKDDGDSHRNRNKNDRQRDDSFFWFLITMTINV